MRDHRVAVATEPLAQAAQSDAVVDSDRRRRWLAWRRQGDVLHALHRIAHAGRAERPLGDRRRADRVSLRHAHSVGEVGDLVAMRECLHADRVNGPDAVGDERATPLRLDPHARDDRLRRVDSRGAWRAGAETRGRQLAIEELDVLCGHRWRLQAGRPHVLVEVLDGVIANLFVEEARSVHLEDLRAGQRRDTEALLEAADRVDRADRRLDRRFRNVHRRHGGHSRRHGDAPVLERHRRTTEERAHAARVSGVEVVVDERPATWVVARCLRRNLERRPDGPRRQVNGGRLGRGEPGDRDHARSDHARCRKLIGRRHDPRDDRPNQANLVLTEDGRHQATRVELVATQ